MIESEKSPIKSPLGYLIENKLGPVIENKTSEVEARNLEFIEKANVTKIGEKWAIIIGISKYQDSDLDLKYADRDAEDFYDILTQSKEGFFKKDKIMKLINEEATARKINKALRQFLKNPDTDDLVLIYFACHGAYDPDRPKNTYLLPYDTELDDIAGTGVDMSEIDNSIKNNSLAKKTIVIADACHSGIIGGNVGRRSIQQPEIVNNYFKDLAASTEGTAVLNSAEAREVALEGKQWGDGHGVFTHYLIEGIKGEADGFGGGEKDGIISIGELFEYVRHMVKESTDNKQHPYIGSSEFDRNLPLIYLESVKQEFAELEGQIILEINQGNYAEVNRLSDEAIRLDPKNHLSYFYKGYALELLDKNDEALRYYDKVIGMKGDYEKAYYRKGQILRFLNKLDEALFCVNEALKINPTYYEARDAKLRLNLEIAKTLKRQQIFDQGDLTEEATESKLSESYYRKRQDHIDSFKFAEHNRAIVIGINECENRDIPVLEGAKNDATELRNILMNPNLGFRISDYHFLRGKDATYSHIINAMLDLFKKYTDKSTNLILFYFSGYGFVDKETMYIAPHDFDPAYPEYFGIKIDVLRNAAYSSNTKANILMIFDCVTDAFVTKGGKSISSQSKNIYAEEIQGISLNDKSFSQLSQDRDNCILLMASSEADMVSRNITDCVDEANPSPHTHGALSYHLIQGLEGSAANNLGLITFDSLQKYIEDRFVTEGRRRPLYSLSEPRPDKIIIGKAVSVFKGKIQEFIRDAKEYSTSSDLRGLLNAVENIKALEELDRDNAEIPGLIDSVNLTLSKMRVGEHIAEWLDRLDPMHAYEIEQIRRGLYDRTFYDIAGTAYSYNELKNMSKFNLRYLILLFYEAETEEELRDIEDISTGASRDFKYNFIRFKERLELISRAEKTE